MRTWQHLIVSRAEECISGVEPAQHDASTHTSASGRNARIINALLTTQMSVHRPIIPTLTAPESRRNSASSTEPNVGFSKRRAPLAAKAASTGSGIDQPGVPLMQWGTGSILPSLVSG